MMPPFQLILFSRTVRKSAVELTDSAAKSSAESSLGLLKVALVITVLSGAPGGMAEKSKVSQEERTNGKLRIKSVKEP